MMIKNELRQLLTGRLLSMEAYAIIFGCGVAIGVAIAWVVWS